MLELLQRAAVVLIIAAIASVALASCAPTTARRDLDAAVERADVGAVDEIVCDVDYKRGPIPTAEPESRTVAIAGGDVAATLLSHLEGRGFTVETRDDKHDRTTLIDDRGVEVDVFFVAQEPASSDLAQCNAPGGTTWAYFRVESSVGT